MAHPRSSELQSSVGMLGSIFASHAPDQSLSLPSSASLSLLDSQQHARAHLQRLSQTSAMPDEIASQMQQQVRQFYLEQSSNNSIKGEAMAMEGSVARQQQQQLQGCPLMLKSLVPDSMQASAGLMRYHSAPSSMLASLVEMGDDFFSPASSSPLHQQGVPPPDSEFPRFYPDDLASSPTSQFDSKRTLPQISKSRTLNNVGGGATSGLETEQRRNEHSDRSRLTSPHSRFKRAAANGIAEEASRATLSAILEHVPEAESFCENSQISLSCGQQGRRTGLTVGVGNLVSDSGTPGYAALPETKSNLVRHSSSPAGLLSRLTTEVQVENSERPNPCFSRPPMHSPSDCLTESTISPAFLPGFATRNCFGASRITTENSDELVSSGRLGASSSSKGGLLRHSSSPAGLLSKLDLDGLADGEKLLLPSSSGNSSEEGTLDGRGGHAFLGSYPWNENVAASGNVMVGSPNGASFAARKRIRELEFASSTLTDSQQRDALEHGGSLENHYSLPTASSPENLFSPDKLSSDSVPCRARAKRGCATHPRSIAERVRRTKISERMRKLQELVPNMDKQTNTADMLDEAVEYVKFLQRQVQELRENRPTCECSCKQKETSSQ